MDELKLPRVRQLHSRLSLMRRDSVADAIETLYTERAAARNSGTARTIGHAK